MGIMLDLQLVTMAQPDHRRWLIIALSCTVFILLSALLYQRSPTSSPRPPPVAARARPYYDVPVPLSMMTLQGGSHTCLQSARDTNGYICVSDDEWRIRKATLLHQAARVDLSEAVVGVGTTPCSHYIQTNFEPSLSCEAEQRLGMSVPVCPVGTKNCALC